MPEPDEAFEAFFNPRGVALIGASRDPRKLGYGIARNLVESRSSPAVHFVNPNAKDLLLGRVVYASVGDVPHPVDLAVLLVPAGSVPNTLVECGRRGIKAVIIASGGFRETGSAGAGLEERCGEIAAEYGIRFLGPNCIGTIDTHLGFNTTFLAPPGPLAGDVAFVSQSGAICAAVIDWSVGHGFGFSRLVSLGNQANVDETDALHMVAADPGTRVVTMYLETVAKGRGFVDYAARFPKPIVALKVGRFEGGKRAVVSHTGAMAGSDEAYRAAFRRAGIIRAESTEAMFDTARALAWAPLPTGRRIAVLTNAGGPGVTAADALEGDGLALAEISPAGRRLFEDFLPGGASLANPVDMLASAAPEDFGRSLQILLDEPGVDGVLVVFAPPPMYSSDQVAEVLVPVIDASPKPVLVAAMGGGSVGPAADRLRGARIPEFRFPERGAAALAVLADRADGRGLNHSSVLPPIGIDRDTATALLAAKAPGWLGPTRSAQLMTAYGIGVPPGLIATTAEDAIRGFDSLGAPLAMKIDDPALIHKSDLGGVQLGVSSSEETREAYDRLATLSHEHGTRSARVHLQAMVETGHDLIVGAVRDPQFGPMVMFGSGGVEVEGLGDVEFALAPLTVADVRFLLARTWAGRRLGGQRGVPGGDVAAVEDVLIKVGWLISDHSAIAEIEINPLRALSPGTGALALDVRARIE